MDQEMRNTIRASAAEAEYDERAKRVLGHKVVLAYILIHTVDEFRRMGVPDVVRLIEGEPMIGTVPADPGLTNTGEPGNGSRIAGFNTEQPEINEGLVRFDIVFYVRTRDGLSQIIINVEAQKDEPTSYHVLNRAVFYVSRLISSQKGRDFIKTDYNDIKRVFSIWICMNMAEDCMSHIHLTKEDVLGAPRWKGRLDLMNIVMIGLAKEVAGQSDGHELHRLLSTLFSRELTPEEKERIIESEYAFPVEEEMRRDLNVMCNLSQGIKEEGLKEGREEMCVTVIMNMQKKGFSPEQISEITGKSVRAVQDVIEKALASA